MTLLMCLVLSQQATAVQDAIKGLKDGTLDPTKEIEIEGLETEEKKRAKEEEKARKKAEYLVILCSKHELVS